MFTRWSYKSGILILAALLLACPRIQVRTTFFSASQQVCFSESSEESKGERLALDAFPLFLGTTSIEAGTVTHHEVVEPSCPVCETAEHSSHQLRGPPVCAAC